jgi:hypothetical protein
MDCADLRADVLSRGVALVPWGGRGGARTSDRDLWLGLDHARLGEPATKETRASYPKLALYGGEHPAIRRGEFPRVNGT